MTTAVSPASSRLRPPLGAPRDLAPRAPAPPALGEALSRERRPNHQAARDIRQKIQTLFDAARARHRVLEHQDAIGMTIFTGSIVAFLANAAAYAAHLIPGWVVLPLAAVLLSFLHELEHDLIHRLYFRDRPFVHNLMMLGVWLLRPSTINPWVRRDWHLHHHRASGTATDVEERALTNGEPWGLRRFFMTLDTMLAIVLRLRTAGSMFHKYAAAHAPAGSPRYRRIVLRNRLSWLPLGLVHMGLMHAFLLSHAWRFVSPATLPSLLGSALPAVDFLAVVLVFPNVLRSICLHFVSSNLHYYGDLEPRNVVQQTQVWTAAWTWPFQAFCFNFGGTHAIHHFVVQEPFYLRQLMAREAQAVMREHGVRFDDFGSFRRANRWSLDEAAAAVD